MGGGDPKADFVLSWYDKIIELDVRYFEHVPCLTQQQQQVSSEGHTPFLWQL